MTILVVNAGSSSLRLAAYRNDATLERLAEARLDSPARPEPRIFAEFAGEHGLTAITCVVHRVVHGGSRFHRPVRIDAGVEADIEHLGRMAPLHNPLALGWIRAARGFVPSGTPAVAAFDTAFYARLPEVAAGYALPAEVCERHGIRRYGFHGLAHQSMLEAWDRAGGDPRARVISLQLGSGCSITACRNGTPVDTSMGFSPLEGLMMATRAGDLDPAAVLHLLEHGGFTPASLLELLNRGSGLLGVSGISADMRRLLASDEPAAARAIAMFCYRVRKYLGAFLAALGGADAVLVGGGIGEHAFEVRGRILEGFEWAGLTLDPQANRELPPDGGFIHLPPGVPVMVTPVDEMLIMARAGRAAVTP